MATFAPSAELEVVKAGYPWAVNLFTEYPLSPDSRVDGTVFAGIVVR